MFYRQCLLLFFASTSLFALNVKETEVAVRKWLAIEVEKSEALRAWEQEKNILESELTWLQHQLDQTNKAISDEEKEKNQTKLEIQKVKATHQKQSTTMQNLKKLYVQQSNQFRQALSRFPMPLKKTFLNKLENQKLASLTVQFSTLLSLMSEAQKLTKRWHLFDQKIKMDDNEILCQVLYAGSSKGFAITRDKSQAFVGTYRQGSWIWTKNSEKKAISKAIQNYKNGGISQCQLPFFGGDGE